MTFLSLNQLLRFLNRQVSYQNLIVDFMLIVLVIQIILEATVVVEHENAVKFDNLIAPVLAKLPLEEDDEVFIYPGFVADVDEQHEQVDDSNNFIYQGDSNVNNNDKDNSRVIIYSSAVGVDSAEPVVCNDVFGEVKDVNADPDTDISYVPVSHFIVEFMSPVLTIDRRGILEHLSTPHRT